MLERKFHKSGLSNYNFRDTAWFQTVREENRSFKYTLILYTLVVILCVPVFILIADGLTGQSFIASRYLFISATLATSAFLFARFRKIRVMTNATVLLMLGGSLYALFLESQPVLFFVLCALYPLVSVLLKGTNRGGVLCVVFAAALALAGLFKFALAPSLSTGGIDVLGLVTGFGLSVLLSGLFLFAERRREQLVDKLTDMLVYDDVTGLPNKDVLVHTIRRGEPYIFAIIKIENFSDLVALFGYEFSDTISQFASQKLHKYESSFGYRTYQLKYNEYGILIERRNPVLFDEAAQILNTLAKSLGSESLPWERDSIRLVYRIGGYVAGPDDDGNPLSRADVALKKAERGHTVVMIYKEDNTEKKSAYEYAIRFSELISNRENDTFRTVFQPIFESNGTDIAWYETLLRIRRQDGSYVSIYPYLNVAKSTGFYQYLTDFVLCQAAEAICEYDVDISVNISINDILRPEFIKLVDETWLRVRDKRGRIIFEILESDELVELDKCIWFIDYISRYEFRIAIDDFGTGYSNYSNLVNLPVDIVKIDGSLIKKIKTDENARLLVEGIVHFCEKSNKKTVAEFVEDVHVFDSLRTMNINYLQGFYLGEPAARAQFSPSIAEETIPPAKPEPSPAG